MIKKYFSAVLVTSIAVAQFGCSKGGDDNSSNKINHSKQAKLVTDTSHLAPNFIRIKVHNQGDAPTDKLIYSKSGYHLNFYFDQQDNNDDVVCGNGRCPNACNIDTPIQANDYCYIYVYGTKDTNILAKGGLNISDELNQNINYQISQTNTLLSFLYQLNQTTDPDAYIASYHPQNTNQPWQVSSQAIAKNIDDPRGIFDIATTLKGVIYANTFVDNSPEKQPITANSVIFDANNNQFDLITDNGLPQGTFPLGQVTVTADDVLYSLLYNKKTDERSLGYINLDAENPTWQIMQKPNPTEDIEYLVTNYFGDVFLATKNNNTINFYRLSKGHWVTLTNAKLTNQFSSITQMLFDHHDDLYLLGKDINNKTLLMVYSPAKDDVFNLSISHPAPDQKRLDTATSSSNTSPTTPTTPATPTIPTNLPNIINQIGFDHQHRLYVASARFIKSTDPKPILNIIMSDQTQTNPNLSQAKQITPDNRNISAPFIVAEEGVIYATEYQNHTATIVKYDPETNQWTSISDPYLRALNLNVLPFNYAVAKNLHIQLDE
ncbi:hypothetical protein [Cysteiniphilum sp. 19S12-1]|uniref:hypothetical protein n=1 Tax=Cysteiniphilum sp. 19S12-1 TaxID=3453130 RepID=UPI003F858989